MYSNTPHLGVNQEFQIIELGMYKKFIVFTLSLRPRFVLPLGRCCGDSLVKEAWCGQPLVFDQGGLCKVSQNPLCKIDCWSIPIRIHYTNSCILTPHLRVNQGFQTIELGCTIVFIICTLSVQPRFVLPLGRCCKHSLMKEAWCSQPLVFDRDGLCMLSQNPLYKIDCWFIPIGNDYTNSCILTPPFRS